jgi:glycerol-3-phosphate dehydrogenase
MAIKLEDILSRRTRCLLLNAAATLEIAPQVARIVAELTGRDANWQAAQLAEFQELAKTYQV